MSVSTTSPRVPRSLLNAGFDLTLRPMRYPRFYEMYRAAIKNTWTVEEIDFQIDLGHLRQRMTPAERHLIERLVAFFATGDSIVSNNVVLSLYRHINSPEARMYLSRQLYEEALHIQFYLTLLDNYVPDNERRAQAFAAIDNIPSIRHKAEFCQRWIDSVATLERIETEDDKRRFLLNLTCFATCIEGLFFFGAFAYVYFLRSRGLLPGLAAGTNWVFRDESAHMAFAFEVIETVRREDPHLFDAQWASEVTSMIEAAVECEMQFADDVLAGGVVGLTRSEMHEYLQYVADQRLTALGLPKRFHARNPFGFMELQDVQELTNFFERRVSAYQVAVQGEVSFDQAF
jgi:ribonucleoside-diphosphate reductase beta chain